MGNFHCIQSECAEVRYQPYKKVDGIRYRYPGEDWVTVDGDDWTIQESSQLYGKHFLYAKTTFMGSEYRGIPACGDIIEIRSRSTYFGRLISIDEIYRDPNSNFSTADIMVDFTYQKSTGQIIATSTRFSIFNLQKNTLQNSSVKAESDCVSYSNAASLDLHDIKFINVSSSRRGKCYFTIFKDGQVVYEESRVECPKVEQSNDKCQLSDRYSVIRVEKDSYLQRVEVRNQDIRAIGIGGSLIDASPLSSECLNIYKTFVAAPPFPNNFVPTAAIFNPYEFVAQICSDPGCPPPKYNVVCRCGQECPSGTCAVFCGNHVCCHDPSTGTAIEQIPIGEYSGGN